MGCTRHRDRKGSLLIRGKKRKLWLSQWPEGNKRMSHKLGWHNEMSRSQAERAHRQWMRIPMKVVSDSDLIPVTCSEVKAVVFGAKRRWRSYRA